MRNLSWIRFAGSVLAATCLTGLAGLAGCVEASDATATVEQNVVYGADDRQDVYEYADRAYADRVASFTATMVESPNTVDASDPSRVKLRAQTLGEAFGLCSGERFADQLTAGACSATLIAPDLLITAGHCVNAGSCAQTTFLFDYYMTSASALHELSSDDVYRCRQVVVHQLDNNAGLDAAIVRLDRPVTGRTPAPVDLSSAALPTDTSVVVHGFPSGLPLKIAGGAKVRDGRAASTDYFVANLDTFGGNSGSGVFRADTGKLVGILVRGDEDYEADPSGCTRVHTCSDDGCGGESSSYAFRPLDALCAAEPQQPLCAGGGGDACPDDPAKTAPGQCGCGVADTDSDADGVADCNDTGGNPGGGGDGGVTGGCSVGGDDAGARFALVLFAGVALALGRRRRARA